jgi:amidohydrolase
MNAKKIAQETVIDRADDLIELSHRIHANPELGFEEEQSSAWCAEVLDKAGFNVQMGVVELDTAFIATVGSGSLHLAICCEYDALPGIGHACGHNMIAAMAVGAGLGLKDLADELDLTVSVFGTPAEEVGDGGGKILMLERGAFDSVDAAMMVHPGGSDAGAVPWNAASRFDVHFHGKEAHAAAAPEMGINALDALTIAQTGIGLLRQHLPGDALVHGIITEGGTAPNIVPAHTSASYLVRAPSMSEMNFAKDRVLKCFEAGALATGSTMSVSGGEKPYASVRNNRKLMKAYVANAESLGREFVPSGAFAGKGAASTDMGNISQVIPSIHPVIGIDSFPAVPHQPEFAAFAVGAVADKAVVEGAQAMAMTAVDLALDETLRAHVVEKRNR